METRGEKIEEFHKHLKYREHILEFAGPKMGGKPAQPDVEKVNRWLEAVSKTDTRARAAITKRMMLLHQVLVLQNTKVENRKNQRGPVNDTTTSAYQCTESVVPTDQYKTNDSKERATDEQARNMVTHAMANWNSWAPRY